MRIEENKLCFCTIQRFEFSSLIYKGQLACHWKISVVVVVRSVLWLKALLRGSSDVLKMSFEILHNCIKSVIPLVNVGYFLVCHDGNRLCATVQYMFIVFQEVKRERELFCHTPVVLLAPFIASDVLLNVIALMTFNICIVNSGEKSTNVTNQR